jgi:hypothetical protein
LSELLLFITAVRDQHLQSICAVRRLDIGNRYVSQHIDNTVNFKRITPTPVF